MLTNQAVGIAMALTQPEVAGVVVSFALHAARAPSVVKGSCLTPHDRIVVSCWQDAARLAGFDRMVIHDRDEGDACEVGNFLSVYRSGQAWSRWGFARAGRSIRAWCCLSGSDVGDFDCLEDALEQVLGGMPADSTIRLVHTPQAVNNLISFASVYGKRFGSAA